MHNLIIYAHPNPNSFNHAVLETITGTLKNKGQKVEVRDLYALAFDPVLKGSDFKALKDGIAPKDIAMEQEFILKADRIIFVYPIWWTGMPAIIKGYIDRVLSYGFAYKYNDKGEIDGLLRGKKILVVNTTGTPSEIYNGNGMTEALKKVSDIGIFNFVGLEVLEHIFFGAVPSVSDTARAEMLEVLKVKLHKLF